MKKPGSLEMNRRMVLRGAGGLMLGLPLLETFMPRKAAGPDGDAVAVRAHRGGGQRRGSGRRQLEREHGARAVLADGDRNADHRQHDRGQGDPVDRRARRLRRQAPHRARASIFRSARTAARTRRPTPRSSRRPTSRRAAPTARPRASRSIPPSRRRRIVAGRDPLVMHAGMFSPAGPASTSPATSPT